MKNITNADRIRSMSDEELARLLNRYTGREFCKEFMHRECCDLRYIDCCAALLTWLQSPVDNEVSDAENFKVIGMQLTIQTVGGAGMTENEVIDVLNNFDKQVTVKADGAYQTNVGEMACKVAIKALEKQIPKKPTTIDYKKYISAVKNAEFLRGAYWCPNCRCVIKCGAFCKNCGQRLDWSKESEGQ